MKLRRDPAGWLTDGRYTLESDWVEEGDDYREVLRWTVWDTETKDHAAWLHFPYPFKTQREARESLASHT